MELQEQTGMLLGNAAGYIATRTIRIGLDNGLFELVGEKGPISSDDIPKLLAWTGYIPRFGVDRRSLQAHWRVTTTTPTHWPHIWSSYFSIKARPDTSAACSRS